MHLAARMLAATWKIRSDKARMTVLSRKL